jgi:RNA polymerase sigma-70 factor (ECF subfamily)
VLKAGRPDTTGYRQALETLCRTYWYPPYADLRRQGFGADEAEDSIQDFRLIRLKRTFVLKEWTC